jgi:hypothetical protein
MPKTSFRKNSDSPLFLTTIHPAVYGIESVLSVINGVDALKGIAIDASLIIKKRGVAIFAKACFGPRRPVI